MVPPRGGGKRSLAGVVLASVVFFACITPWLVREYSILWKVHFLSADNFGRNYAWEWPGADGTWTEYLHPTQDVYALRHYQAMGEIAYVAMRKRQAIDTLRQILFVS